jgi:hypothetical protein
MDRPPNAKSFEELLREFLQDPEVQELLRFPKAQQLVSFKIEEFRSQYDNRFQESIQNLSQESSQLRYENQYLKSQRESLKLEVKRAETLLNGMIAKLHKQNDEAEYLRGRRPKWLQDDYRNSGELVVYALMPYGHDWFKSVYAAVKGAVAELEPRNKWECMTAWEDTGRVIKDNFWKGLCRARVVVADLTENNPNVTYEIGLADLLGKKMILIAQSRDVVFYFKEDRLLLYDKEDLTSLKKKLVDWIGSELQDDPR